MKWLNPRRPTSLVFRKVVKPCQECPVSESGSVWWRPFLAFLVSESPRPRRHEFGLSHHAPDRSIPQGLDLLPRGMMQLGALLRVLGTREAWPCLATDLKKPIPRTKTFCGWELLLKLVRKELQCYSGFCTRVVPQWVHPLEVHPGRFGVSHTCPAYLSWTAGLWWSCVVQGEAERPPGCICA